MNSLPFASTWVHPRFSGEVHVARSFSFLCCVFLFCLFLFSVVCAQCYRCLWIVQSTQMCTNVYNPSPITVVVSLTKPVILENNVIDLNSLIS